MPSAQSLVPSIHAQLDVIEELRASMHATPPADRLQALCEGLYGEAVPAAWIERALAPNAPEPASAPAGKKQGIFKALHSLMDRVYSRPLSKDQWCQRQTEIKRFSFFEILDGIQVLGFFFGGLLTLMGGVFCFDPQNILVGTVLLGMGLPLIGFGVFFVCQQKALSALRRWKTENQAHEPSKEDWDEWLRWPSVAAMVLDIYDTPSGVPMLRGDAVRFNDLTQALDIQCKKACALEEARRLVKRSQVRSGIESSAS